MANIEAITGQNDELLEKKKQIRMSSHHRDVKKQGYYSKMIPSFTNEKRK